MRTKGAIRGGLERFVKLDKPEFIGRDALLKRKEAGPQALRVTLRIEADHAPAPPGASLMDGDQVVGTITSGEWGHRVGMNLAYAFVKPDFAATGTRMQLDLCGVMVGAEVIDGAVYDPGFERLRA